MDGERKAAIRACCEAGDIDPDDVVDVLDALDAADARAEEAEAAAYPTQLAEIRAAVEVYCEPPLNGGHVQAIRRLAAERDRLREALAQVVEWIDNWSPDFTEEPDWQDTVALIHRALPECREVGDGR